MGSWSPTEAYLILVSIFFSTSSPIGEIRPRRNPFLRVMQVRIIFLAVEGLGSLERIKISLRAADSQGVPLLRIRGDE